jgi:hypothetical protein
LFLKYEQLSALRPMLPLRAQRPVARCSLTSREQVTEDAGMSELETRLAGLRRPRLLVSAARMAATATCAGRRARRRPVARLLAEEATLEAARLGGGLGYSPRRHVQVMSALIAAARDGMAAAEQGVR